MLGSSEGSDSIAGIGSMAEIGSAGIELGSISTSFSSKYLTSPVVQFDSILPIINYPSYMMLTVPASKVLRVVAVILTLSRTPEVDPSPAPQQAFVVLFLEV